jgi:primosomal protein N' (replication factor Y) (superfamily II helicase)
VTRAVRVITEVAAVDRPFDYTLSDALSDALTHVGVGDRVRVDFHGRSVRAWVVDDVPSSDDLKGVKKWLGYGPPASELPLLQWASNRWYSSWSRFLLAASPQRVITLLPKAPSPARLSTEVPPGFEPGVVQLAPTTDPLPLVLSAYEATREREGSLLVLVPTDGWATRLRGRLEQRGCAVAQGDDDWDRMRAGWPVVVGARGSALAPVPTVAGAVIIDADDESFRSRASPTWDSVSMLRERCSRDGAPLWCTSMLPSPVLLDRGDYQRDPDLVGGWPRVTPVDRRSRDPHEGVLSEVSLRAAHTALESDEPVAVVVILQRLGTGRLLACARCGELARCTQCQQAEEEVGDQLACADRHEVRARFCRHCGSTKLRGVRSGVTTLARDVGAQLNQVVSEVTAASSAAPLARVVVGTEATWQHVRRCGVVIFADFDQYLLAPRESARRSAISAVGKAGRLVGARRDGRGSVIVQTRRGEDAVIDALVNAHFDDLIREDVETTELLGLPPYGARAQVTGEGADEFVQGLSESGLAIVRAPSGYVVRARDVDTLTSALRDAPRPPSKFRVAVD